MAVIYIGVPREERVYTRSDDSVELVTYKLSERNLLGGVLKARASSVDEGRNQLVDKFLERPHATHLLFLDSDEVFPPDIGHRLLLRQKPVISALRFTRGAFQLPQLYRHAGRHPDRLGAETDRFESMMEEVYQFLQRHQLPQGANAYVINTDDGLFRIDGCGCGALLVAREVFERIDYPWFRLARGVGEDFHFCLKAAEAGYEIWGDCSVICGHINLKVVGQSEFGHSYALLKEVNHYLDDGLVEDLAAYVSLTTDEVRERMANSPNLAVAEKWRQANPQTPEEVVSFYRSCQEYLFDLAMWNASDPFRGLVGMLPDVSGKRVLDFGAGLGSLSMLLQSRGARVDYLDLPGLPSEFAQFRAKRLGLYHKMGWLNSLDATRRRYDLVIAIDVFEHLADLPTELKRIARALKPGGLLFFHNNFGQQELHPMHIDWSREWPRLLAEAGLVEEIPGKTATIAAAPKPNINTAPYWDQIWARERLDTWRQYPETFQKIAAHIDESESVLDVGCGVGVLLDTIRAHCKEVAGLDISPVAIDLLRSKGIPGRVGVLPEICFPDKSFDIVVATEIVEHLDDPVRLLGEAARVARKKVIITVPDNVLAPDECAEHRAVYTKETLTQMLEQFFDDIEIESFTDTFDTPTVKIALPTLLAKCNVRAAVEESQ